MSGRYATRFDELVHELTLDASWLDAEAGTVDDIGWHGLVMMADHYRPAWWPRDCRGVIVVEDSQGFVYVDKFYNRDELLSCWRDVVEYVDTFHQDEEN